MAEGGVMQCVSGVESSFRAAADLVQANRDRREKRKKRREKEKEQAVKEGMLHESLIDGAKRCHAAAMDGFQRFGTAFDEGDHAATNELKDVMMSLQTGIIRALVQASPDGNASLDFSRLMEASFTIRSNAIRCMDALRDRLEQRHLHAGVSQYSNQLAAVSNSGHVYGRFDRDRQPSEPTLGGMHPHGRSSGLGIQERSADRNFHQMRRILKNHPQFATHSESLAAPATWMRQTTMENSRSPAPQLGQVLGDSDVEDDIHEGDNEESQPIPGFMTLNLDEGDTSRSQSTGTNFEDRPESSRSSNATSNHNRGESGSVDITWGHSCLTTPPPESLASTISSTAQAPSRQPFSIDLLRLTISEHEAESERAGSAPEVVTREYESMLSPRLPGSPTHNGQGPYAFANGLPNMNTAFADGYAEDSLMTRPEPEHIWSPLTRPVKMNDYHGFCRGAWDTRRSMSEGLSICLIPNDNGINVPYWKCKRCEFRSKGMNSSKMLPDQIYFDDHNIRYRWLFLAKSHVRARTAHNKPEKYAYGCIFCAAEGRDSDTHKSLEALMNHLISKHKTHMMTPEVLARTRCIVGGVPSSADNWDVNIPHSNPKKVAGAVGEFFLSATTGISKYS